MNDKADNVIFTGTGYPEIRKIVYVNTSRHETSQAVIKKDLTPHWVIRNNKKRKY